MALIAQIGAQTRPAAGDDTPAAAGDSPAATVQCRAVHLRRGGARAQSRCWSATDVAPERAAEATSPAREDRRRRRRRCAMARLERRRDVASGRRRRRSEGEREPVPAPRSTARRARARRLGLGASRARSNAFGGEDTNLEDFVAAGLSLADHLTEQLHVVITDPAERLIGAHLIHMVDEAGYLRGDLDDLADKLGAPQRADREGAGDAAGLRSARRVRARSRRVPGAAAARTRTATIRRSPGCSTIWRCSAATTWPR